VDAVATPTVAMLTVAGVSAVCTVLFGLGCRGAVPERKPTGARLRRYASLLAMTALLGAVGGTLEIYAPAVAIAAGHPGAAGILVAIATLGTLIGAAVAVRRPLPLRVALAVQIVGAAVLLVPASLVLAGIALVVLGLGFTPALSGLSAAIAERSGGTAISFGWQSTALGLGVAAGSALAGAAVAVAAHLSALPAVIAAVSCLAVTTLVRDRAPTEATASTDVVSGAARR
jgi:hypothetical protein